MKKNSVCILTETDLNNYGNRLQNVALSLFLEKRFNVVCKTLWPIIPPSLYHKIGYISRSIVAYLKIHLLKRNKFELVRHQKFVFFNRNIRKNWSLLMPFRSLAIANNHFDSFVVGSDQVFSDQFGIPDVLASLSFAPVAKRFTYAASIGNNPLSIDKYRLVCQELSHFHAISVRERKSVEDIKKYTSSKISVNVDPAFLLTKDEWRSLCEGKISAKTKDIAKNPYLLVYWLGDETSEIKQIIKNRARCLGLSIVTLRTNSTDSENTYIDSGPYDFVYLMDHASFVVSKSFHGTVFALVFNKPFISFDPAFNSNSKQIKDNRLANLQNIFKLPISCFDLRNKENPKLDWAEINKIIVSEREKTFLYFAQNGFPKKDC
ncbi:MAG: polysaccharide pyruvyl transferase family protein [Bacilli bacterium]|jgi:hypothetical protein|nr:polysaccharide pyruvyl transferase family protein [Bacilli bacterium]